MLPDYLKQIVHLVKDKEELIRMLPEELKT